MMKSNLLLTFHLSGFISAFLSSTPNVELVHTGTFSAARLMQMTVLCPITLLDERIK